ALHGASEMLEVAALRDVAADGHRVSARGRDLRGERFEPFDAPGRDHDGGASARERDRRPLSQAGGGSRHDRDGVLQLHRLLHRLLGEGPPRLEPWTFPPRTRPACQKPTTIGGRATTRARSCCAPPSRAGWRAWSVILSTTCSGTSSGCARGTPASSSVCPG